MTREAVLRASDVHEGVNLFSVDLSHVRERLATLPQVEDSHVERVLPDRIVLKIQERRPVAWVTPPGVEPNAGNVETVYLIDRRGVLLKTKALPAEYAGLPRIVGFDTGNYAPGQAVEQDEVRAALDLLRADAEMLQARFQIATVDVSKGYCLIASDRQKAAVTFGLEHPEEQLQRLELLLNYCEQNSKELQTVNLMAERNVPVTFAPPPEPVVDPTGGDPAIVGAGTALGAVPAVATTGAVKSGAVKRPGRTAVGRTRGGVRPAKPVSKRSEKRTRVRRAVPVE